jgi:organic hydroperoxide reductase OsmC/OhrA
MTSFKNALSCPAGGPAVTTMSGAKDVEIGPPAEYGGSTDTLNPEELFVASINSCLMLVFFHFAEKSGVEIEHYESEAEGTVEKTRNGLRFTDVRVQAKIKVPTEDGAGKLNECAELAEKFCLVSNSVSCPVSYNVVAA